MRLYVCTFAFSLDRSRVLLIRKNRPPWQAGKLNGVGGKIEPGETPVQAARRELREESGIDWPEIAFERGLVLRGDDDAGAGVGWEGHFFRAFGEIDQARTCTDEPIQIHLANPVPADTIPNLRWIIPLLLDDQAVAEAYETRVGNGVGNEWHR